MLFNSARLGDAYCYELILYLYKTYYKKEYNQLKLFKTIGVQEIFSLTELNCQRDDAFMWTSFDSRCLPELREFEWYDILRMAAFRQCNSAISPDAICYGTGRLKIGYRV